MAIFDPPPKKNFSNRLKDCRKITLGGTYLGEIQIDSTLAKDFDHFLLRDSAPWPTLAKTGDTNSMTCKGRNYFPATAMRPSYEAYVIS